MYIDMTEELLWLNIQVTIMCAHKLPIAVIHGKYGHSPMYNCSVHSTVQYPPACPENVQLSANHGGGNMSQSSDI